MEIEVKAIINYKRIQKGFQEKPIDQYLNCKYRAGFASTKATRVGLEHEKHFVSW